MAEAQTVIQYAGCYFADFIRVPSASEVTTLQRYTNVFIVIIHWSLTRHRRFYHAFNAFLYFLSGSDVYTSTIAAHCQAYRAVCSVGS